MAGGTPTSTADTALPRDAGVAGTPQSTETEVLPEDFPSAPSEALPTGTWSSRAQAPVALTEVAAAEFAGQIWVAGGLDANGEAVTTVQVYDPTFDAWSSGPPLPEAVHHSALVSAGDAVYLVGGYVGSSFTSPTAVVRRFDAATGAWMDVAALPSPRAAGAVAWDGQRLVYAGGVGPQGVAADVFEGNGESWSRLGALSVPREHLAAASDGEGRTFVLGGRQGGLETNLATVDLVEGQAVRPLGELRTPRGGAGAFFARGRGACLAGGEERSGTLAAVECIDAAGGVTALPDLAVPRHGLGAAAVDGIAFTLLGGPQPGLFVSDAVEALRL